MSRPNNQYGLTSQRRLRGHDFLPPKTLLERIPKLDATAEQDPAEIIIWLHYFGPAGDWWISEIDPAEGLAFGYVRLAACPEFAEWGSIGLAELEALTVTVPLAGRALTVVAVERDRHWKPVKFRDATIVPPEWFAAA
jgi:DUF2958 family protein